jgi:hypothetical protein
LHLSVLGLLQGCQRTSQGGGKRARRQLAAKSSVQV